MMKKIEKIKRNDLKDTMSYGKLIKLLSTDLKVRTTLYSIINSTT